MLHCGGGLVISKRIMHLTQPFVAQVRGMDSSIRICAVLLQTLRCLRRTGYYVVNNHLYSLKISIKPYTRASSMRLNFVKLPLPIKHSFIFVTYI